MKLLTEAEHAALLLRAGPMAEWSTERMAVELVEEAARRGQVLTIEQVPTQPLRMGGYVTRVAVRPAREMAS